MQVETSEKKYLETCPSSKYASMSDFHISLSFFLCGISRQMIIFYSFPPTVFPMISWKIYAPLSKLFSSIISLLRIFFSHRCFFSNFSVIFSVELYAILIPFATDLDLDVNILLYLSCTDNKWIIKLMLKIIFENYI